MNKNAKWITSPVDAGSAVYAYRREWKLEKPVKKATLCATAVGIYAAFLNGTRIGNAVLTPGWTEHKTRVLSQTYDVTSLLGANPRLEIGVARGWAVGKIGNSKYLQKRVALCAALEILYADGSRESIVTDTDWEVYTTEVLSSEIYHGETVDKTAPITLVGKAIVADEVTTKATPHMGEAITEQERLAPVAVFRTPKNELVVDFGQNMTGYAELCIQAPRGSRIVMHHAEVLDAEGNFYTANMRKATNENLYICSGNEDIFKPTYTFQGFRYVRLTEYPFETVDPNSIRAVVVHSDMKRTGYFRCGNEQINQLYHNIVWGQKSNYLDIPTDCPQRDERLGWTGDTQVFCRTGSIIFDTERFFNKWMGDVAIAQKKDGAIPIIVPACLDSDRYSAAWGDVACVVPWELYMAYGNKKMLARHFSIMKKWVEYIHHYGPEEFLWLGATHFGDWLAMDAGEDSYVGATSYDLIASAFFAYSTSLLIKAGEALGKNMTEYHNLYQNVVRAFRSYFMENGMPKETLPLTQIDRRGRLDQCRGMTQTAIVLILYFGLCEDSERAALVEKLADLIRENGACMSTGFVGTPYILHALSENGRSDVAYELLFQERSPSWLYSVNHGATTMWEHWNSIKEDGSFWSTDMNSFNHYAYGAVFDWIFGVACGIKPIAPAYREVSVTPHPDRRLGFADTSIETRNGLIRAHWYYKGETVYYEITVPQGVTAHVTLPSGYTETVGGGTYHFAE